MLTGSCFVRPLACNRLRFSLLYCAV
eukprot:COSAG06_NODE_64211_length_260_cov_0.639752_2_plen_25_part_01